MCSQVRRTVPWLAVWALAGVSSAQPIQTQIDILDPSDGALNLPPSNVLCVDVLLSISPLEGAWTAAGLRAVAQNGATLRYVTDPNSGSPILINPGTNNRFVTFFSQPRPRDASIRFTNGAAAVAGRYSPTGPTPLATPTQVNVADYASPPPSIGSPVVDGAVLRVSINLPAGHEANEYALVSRQWGGLTVPPDAILYSTGGVPGDVGTINAAFVPETVSRYDWYVAPIPEPGSMAGILALAALLRFRR